MPDGATGSRGGLPSGLRQLRVLHRLWWHHMRRRALRVGVAPSRSGAPTFLLLNLFLTAYMALVAARMVFRSVSDEPAAFAWHILGVLLIGFGSGMAQGAARLQLRGTRNDTFLEPLPLLTLARIGFQFADQYMFVPVVLGVPLAARAALGPIGWDALPAASLAGLSLIVLFVVGQAVVAWARALGPAPTASRFAYLGIGVNLLGAALVFTPFGRLAHHSGAAAGLLARTWLQPGAPVYVLHAGVLLLGLVAYRGLLAAERVGFDRLDVQGRAPRPEKGVQNRASLEWLMTWRQGGKVLMFAVTAAMLVWATPLLVRVPVRVPPVLLRFLSIVVVYMGALQTIGQAGRAARADLMARPFLSALPLSPHQVLEGKALALRKLLVPMLVGLALLGGVGAWQHSPSFAYRMALAMLALIVVVDGAVSLAFLTNGIGVMGVAGGQPSSGFSTSLLTLPLLAVVVANDAWTATTACLAVVAVSWEARRAARKSVRWLDDPDDELERETTVWRALVVVTAFFSAQALSFGVLDLFHVRPGYLLASTFAMGAALLLLLTWRNALRFDRPRFTPIKLWCWPLGALSGGASGMLALRMAELLPPSAVQPARLLTIGEIVAVFATLVVIAPLAEEYFFRGWLQKAIERDLPPARKQWALALGALAFALAHVGTYGVPQLVLGLVAGALYMLGGGLWPAILAHAVHNGVVLLAAP